MEWYFIVWLVIGGILALLALCGVVYSLIDEDQDGIRIASLALVLSFLWPLILPVAVIFIFKWAGEAVMMIRKEMP